MLPFYPFYWADYSSKTFDLTMEQHGAYMLFLRHIYTTGKPIPAKQCFSIARALTEQQQENATIVLEKFFFLDGENWRNLRCEEVINEQNARHQKRVDAGRSGGNAKAAALPKQKPSNARAKPKQCPSNQNQNQNQSIISSLRSEINISNELWQKFLDHRKKVKASTTQEAEKLVLEKLKAWKQKGHNPEEIIKNSIENGWKGVFEPKNQQNQNSSTHNASGDEPKYYNIGKLEKHYEDLGL